jgi:hypothetical protein
LSQTDSLLVQRLNLSVDFGKCGRCGVSISSFVSCVSFHTLFVYFVPIHSASGSLTQEAILSTAEAKYVAFLETEAEGRQAVNP